MTIEGTFPKVPGDILYASEANSIPTDYKTLYKTGVNNKTGSIYQSIGSVVITPHSDRLRIVSSGQLTSSNAGTTASYRLSINGSEVTDSVRSVSYPTAIPFFTDVAEVVTSGTEYDIQMQVKATYVGSTASVLNPTLSAYDFLSY